MNSRRRFLKKTDEVSIRIEQLENQIKLQKEKIDSLDGQTQQVQTDISLLKTKTTLLEQKTKTTP